MGEYRDIQTTSQETLDQSTEAVAELSDGTRLLRTDDGRGIVDPGEEYTRAMTFDKWDDARLAFGLLARVGTYTTPESPTSSIPVEIVREGRDACAAYLLVGSGVKNSRSYVARKLGVSEQTVSNYANRVRWDNE